MDSHSAGQHRRKFRILAQAKPAVDAGLGRNTARYHWNKIPRKVTRYIFGIFYTKYEYFLDGFRRIGYTLVIPRMREEFFYASEKI